MSRTVYIDGIGRQTPLSTLFRRCPKCPSFAVQVALQNREYFAFTFHFINLRIGQRLFFEFLYGEQNDFSGWALMRYGVDSHLCRMPHTAIPLPLRWRSVRFSSEVHVDILQHLCRGEVEDTQLVCRRWRAVVDANAQRLPLRLFDSVHLETIASGMCAITQRRRDGVSGNEFAFQSTNPFSDFRLVASAILRCSRILALTVHGNIDEFISFGLFDVMRMNIIVPVLRVHHECTYSWPSLQALTEEAVHAWKTCDLRLYAAKHIDRFLALTHIIRRLSRLDVSVPTVDCRRNLDELLFNNRHLEVRLQFMFGWWSSPYFGFCMEQCFWQHYFDTVIDRLQSGNDLNFVECLYIRTVPFLWLARDATAVGYVEDGGKKMLVYFYPGKTPYQVCYGLQRFEDQHRHSHDSIRYYIITRGNDRPPAGSQRIERRISFVDWIIRNVHFREPPAQQAHYILGPPFVVATSWFPSSEYFLAPL